MSKKLKVKFSASILIGIELFIYCSIREELITVPIEFGIACIVVMITSIFVNNINVADDKLKIEIWQLKVMYCALLLIIITFAVILGDLMKEYM